MVEGSHFRRPLQDQGGRAESEEGDRRQRDREEGLGSGGVSQDKEQHWSQTGATVPGDRNPAVGGQKVTNELGRHS